MDHLETRRKGQEDHRKEICRFPDSRFNVNAQPYYVLLDTTGNLLAKPQAYDLDVDHFISFLNTGLENFKKQQTSTQP